MPRKQPTNATVKYDGITFNLRNAYDRGYLDGLKGFSTKEGGKEYRSGYDSGSYVRGKR